LSGSMTDALKTTIDPKTGVQIQFSHPNPSGGQDEITVVAYDFVEGLWLPAEMSVHNSTTGWDAEVKFSGWIINQPDSALPFK
jgi:hypothetical protein